MAKLKAPKSIIVDLRFPIGGLNRAVGFDQQPPYTTGYCQNVRPFDTVSVTAGSPTSGMRQRGGARPGLVKAYSLQCGSGPIQMAAWAGVLGSNGAVTSTIVLVAGGDIYYGSGSTLTHLSSSNLNSTALQLQATEVSPYLYIADYKPTNVSGLNGAITHSGTTGTLTDALITSGVASAISTTLDVIWLSGTNATQENVFPILSKTTGSLTFDMTGAPIADQATNVVWQIGRAPKVYDPANPGNAPTPLMGPFPIPPSNYIIGTVSSTSGAVTGSGTTWTSANIPSVVLASPTAYNLTLTVPNPTGIGTQQYAVSAVADSTHLTLVDQTTDADCATAPYTLAWTTPTTYYGVPPLNCNLTCTYRGRLVLAGPGSIWYMSRIGVPTDFDYGFDPNDPSRAVAGIDSTAGGIPEPILALMPHSDQYLIFGCEHSLWLLNGDPTYSGQITALSRDIGVLGPNAWCNLPDGSVVFLSRDGVYQISPGASSPPTGFSRTLLPVELLNVDWVSNTVTMAYDVDARGIHLSIVPTGGGAGTHYFIDWVSRSFWTVVLPNGMQPTAMVRYAKDSTVPQAIIYGCYDGYARKYSYSATTDDGTSFTSFVTYGPFRFGGAGYYGQVVQIAVDLDTNGHGASWGIYQADTAEGAIAAAVAQSGSPTAAPWHGSLLAGVGNRDYPMALGAGMVIVVGGTYGWAVEGCRVQFKRKGPLRGVS